MALNRRALVFGKFLFVAQNNTNSSFHIDIRELSPDEDSKIVQTWKCSRKLTLPLTTNVNSQAPPDIFTQSKSRMNILLFETVEDRLSGVIRPTLLLQVSEQNKSPPTVYIFVLLRETNPIITDKVSCETSEWKLRAVKKFKSSKIFDFSNLSVLFVDQFSFLCIENGHLLCCYDEKEETLVHCLNVKTEIVYIVQKHCDGKCYIFGVSSIKDTDDISDANRGNTNFSLFVKKCQHVGTKIEFDNLDSSEFLPDDYSSCISSIYVNSIQAIPAEDNSSSENHSSDIFLILSSAYVLEFVSGQLVLSLHLTQICRDINILSCDNVSESTKILGAIEVDKNKKVMILKCLSTCIAIDTSTQKVYEYWNDVEHVFIEDVLCKGRDQLLLIFQSVDGDINRWFLTDFNTVFIDGNQRIVEEQPENDSNAKYGAARNALQQQLTRMNLSVENAEDRLREKIEFLETNFLRIQEEAAVQISYEEDKLKSIEKKHKIKKDYHVDVKHVWHRMVDDHLVVGVCIINRHSRPLSRLSISLVNQDNKSVLTSKSKWHEALDSPIEMLSVTSHSDEHNIFKKLKLDRTRTENSINLVLLPEQEACLTLCCEVSNLTDVPKEIFSLSLFLHYSSYQSLQGSEVIEDKKMSAVKSCEIILLPLKDILNSTFTDQILQTTSSFNNICTGTVLYHGKLCLNTIQNSISITMETKYGLLDHIDYCLKKIPGLVYHSTLSCYIYNKPGILYLVRLELTLSGDFKHAHGQVYSQNNNQFKVFMQILSSHLPDNVLWKLATPSNTTVLINNILMSANKEINTGISMSSLSRQDIKMEEDFDVDFKNSESAANFRAKFEIEQQTLSSMKSNFLPETKTNLFQSQLRKSEEMTDKSVRNMFVQTDAESVLL